MAGSAARGLAATRAALYPRFLFDAEFHLPNRVSGNPAGPPAAVPWLAAGRWGEVGAAGEQPQPEASEDSGGAEGVPGTSRAAARKPACHSSDAGAGRPERAAARPGPRVPPASPFPYRVVTDLHATEIRAKCVELLKSYYRWSPCMKSGARRLLAFAGSAIRNQRAGQ